MDAFLVCMAKKVYSFRIPLLSSLTESQVGWWRLGLSCTSDVDPSSEFYVDASFKGSFAIEVNFMDVSFQENFSPEVTFMDAFFTETSFTEEHCHPHLGAFAITVHGLS